MWSARRTRRRAPAGKRILTSASKVVAPTPTWSSSISFCKGSPPLSTRATACQTGTTPLPLREHRSPSDSRSIPQPFRNGCRPSVSRWQPTTRTRCSICTPLSPAATTRAVSPPRSITAASRARRSIPKTSSGSTKFSNSKSCANRTAKEGLKKSLVRRSPSPATSMAEPRDPDPVLLVAAAFSRHHDVLTWGRAELESAYGPTGVVAAPFSFHETGYYEPTMGPGLLKQLLAFRELVRPEMLATIKLQTNQLEERLA